MSSPNVIDENQDDETINNSSSDISSDITSIQSQDDIDDNLI